MNESSEPNWAKVYENEFAFGQSGSAQSKKESKSIFTLDKAGPSNGASGDGNI